MSTLPVAPATASAAAPAAACACPACAAAAPVALTATDTNHATTPERFAYHRCPACGLWFVDPVPADLGRYYPRTYHSIPADAAGLAAAAAIDRYKIELVLRHAQGGRLLEIGPSYGMFLHLARSAGFTAEGIEMDEGCCRFLGGLGFTVHHATDVPGALAALPLYQVVALWHVFEHLPSPWTTLAALAAHVAPGGVLVLAQPNPLALQFRLFGRRWTHLDAPRHLQLVPPALLARRLAELGFVQAELTATDPGSLGWNRFGWVHSLRNLARARPLRFLLHVLARGVELLAMPLERRGLRGTAYTAVFRKAPAP